MAPRWMGLGAAAALNYLDPNLKEEDIASKLAGLWSREVRDSDEWLEYIRNGFIWLKGRKGLEERLDTYWEN